MKNKLLLLLLVCSLKGFGQVIADPALSDMQTSVDPSLIPLNSLLTLKVPVRNMNLVNSLPAGTCKIKIGLGSKLALAPGFDLATVNTSNYFNWTSVFSGGQVEITGELVTALPANFLDTATFSLKGMILGSSTVTTNFLITNHNTILNLSDENSTNNSTFLPYTVVNGIVPVNFTNVRASREGCLITVSFATENEINVHHYEIETSKDAMHYEKKAQLAAANLVHYKYQLAITEDLKSTQLYVRIKSIDNDGQYKYSETKIVSGICDHAAWKLNLYPNPVDHATQKLTLQLTTGSFNGKYIFTLSDMSGKILERKNIHLLNTTRFDYVTKSLAAGQYLVRVSNIDGREAATLKFQKL